MARTHAEVEELPTFDPGRPISPWGGQMKGEVMLLEKRWAQGRIPQHKTALKT